MEPWIIVFAVVQLLTIGATLGGFIRLSRQLNMADRRLDQIVQRIQDRFIAYDHDIESVVGVRDSMDQEIRERQASIDTVARLVGRQGRAISEHIESNLHR